MEIFASVIVIILVWAITILGFFQDKFDRKKLIRIIITIAVVGTVLQLVSTVLQQINENHQLIINEGIRKHEKSRQDSLSQKIDSLLFNNKIFAKVNDSLTIKLETQSAVIKDLMVQTNELDVLGNKTLHVVNYSQELNHEIRTAYFNIILKKVYQFKDLYPVVFAFEFDTMEPSTLSFRKLVFNGGETINLHDQKIPAVSYRILDISFDDTAKVINNFIQGSRETNLKNILIPINPSKELKGFVKDFHDERLYPYFPQNLIDKIDSVELIVNGWSILSEPIDKVFWRQANYEWLSLITNKIKLFRPTSDPKGDRPPFSYWRIDVYNKLPKYYRRLSAKVWPSSLYDGLIFKSN